MGSADLDTGVATTPLRRVPRRRSITTTASWIGPQERPLSAWITGPADAVGTIGVVMVPPLGYEAFTSHRTMRAMAEHLAAQGCTVLRFDLDGTGDSSGDASDPDRLDAWRRSVHDAAAFLRSGGIGSLILVGGRFGGTLALEEAATVGADRVVAWAPVVRGRDYVRQLRLLGKAIDDDSAHPALNGGITLGGFPFGPATLDDLRSVDLNTLGTAPAPRILVIDRDDRPPSDDLIGRLAGLGCQVDHSAVPGSETALDVPTEYAGVADAVVQRVLTWVGPSAPGGPPLDGQYRVRFTHDSCSEEVVRLGGRRMVGVLTEPDQPRKSTVVLLNSGSEPHVGPGRTWVEFARALAEDGHASVRLDFTGWGESPDRDPRPGRPYDAHCSDDLADACADLRSRGHRTIAVLGLCAGAWTALHVADPDRYDGVIAINPQLYWQPGDPVEASIATETRPRRLEEIRRFRRIRHTGAWWVLDALGVRHPAAARLRELDRSGVEILMVFGEGDDGLEFLEDRVGRSFRHVVRRGHVEVEVVPDVDHSMQQFWRRPAVLACIRPWLDRLVADA